MTVAVLSAMGRGLLSRAGFELEVEPAVGPLSEILFDTDSQPSHASERREFQV